MTRSHRFWPPLIKLLLSLATSLVRADGNSSIVATYTTASRNVNFTHVTYCPQLDKLYVGASNHILQLNSLNLTVERSVQTGPVRDSVTCSPLDCHPDQSEHQSEHSAIPLVNTVNKLLVIDNNNQLLIQCGSTRQGVCQRHHLRDISLVEDLIPLPVVANDENSSTIALVAPAKYFGSNTQHVLYVAATNSRLGPYRDMVPAICSRSLESGPRLLHVVERAFDSARVDISSHLRDYYLVRYVFAFHSSDFVYFATVQRKSHLRALEEEGHVSRLARVCQSDAAYNTYTEVTLQCLSANQQTDYTLLQSATIVGAGSDLAKDMHLKAGERVLVGVFSTAVDHTSSADSRSAICVFSLAEIEERFTQNIHMCYNGSMTTRNMDYIAGNVPDCPTPGRGGNIVSFCLETLKLNGSQPIQSIAAKVFANQTLTAVTALTSDRHTLLFVGTRSGRLKKLLLSRADFAQEFDELEVDSKNAIISDLIVDKQRKHVIAASHYKLVKVIVEHCPHVAHNSCRACLSTPNPFCGWCPLTKRCSLQHECHLRSRDVNNSQSQWLSLDVDQCVDDFHQIRPKSLPITSNQSLELVIRQLPPLPANSRYQCVFGDGPPINATITNSGLTCATPPVSWRPQTPSGADHVLVDLRVRSSESKQDFLQRKFAFYDCSAHKSCVSCLQSEFDCLWRDSACADRQTTRVLNNSSGDHVLVEQRLRCPLVSDNKSSSDRHSSGSDSTPQTKTVSVSTLRPTWRPKTIQPMRDQQMRPNNLRPNKSFDLPLAKADNKSGQQSDKGFDLPLLLIVIIVTSSLTLVLLLLISVAIIRHKNNERRVRCQREINQFLKDSMSRRPPNVRHREEKWQSGVNDFDYTAFTVRDHQHPKVTRIHLMTDQPIETVERSGRESRDDNHFSPQQSDCLVRGNNPFENKLQFKVATLQRH